ncbi:MAG: hypothetical protein A2V81_02425 [Candidatus Abawacabacteria bacterium RBG_16_42_10]|uniref:Uncharacterized protein n=1 Tax=Candidatus Abawacabacteria bacterium RBG_16_42_10 TaxID=1817814 RepID=A0A1F4XKX6_9BACT|nr:MAG: hypothetical protein A2V81_02425 [Candidatus Abawacabacteria bacterium RBG_16_42_10]
MPNTPSPSPAGPDKQPKFPTPREIEVLYPRLDHSEQLLQEAGRIFIAKTLEGKEMDKAALIQVYLNYCHAVADRFPLYTEQAKMAFNYIEEHASNIDINDNRGHLRELYPFLGPLVTTIRRR